MCEAGTVGYQPHVVVANDSGPVGEEMFPLLGAQYKISSLGTVRESEPVLIQKGEDTDLQDVVLRLQDQLHDFEPECCLGELHRREHVEKEEGGDTIEGANLSSYAYEAILEHRGERSVGVLQESGEIGKSVIGTGCDVYDLADHFLQACLDDTVVTEGGRQGEYMFASLHKDLHILGPSHPGLRTANFRRVREKITQESRGRRMVDVTEGYELCKEGRGEAWGRVAQRRRERQLVVCIP